MITDYICKRTALSISCLNLENYKYHPHSIIFMVIKMDCNLNQEDHQFSRLVGNCICVCLNKVEFLIKLHDLQRVLGNFCLIYCK